MELTVRQLSSLDKFRKTDPMPDESLKTAAVPAGQRFSYQIALKSDLRVYVSAQAESDFPGSVRLYAVKDAVMDVPVDGNYPMEDYITHTPGLMPDILIPLEEAGKLTVTAVPATLWVKADAARDAAPGVYPIRITLTAVKDGGEVACVETAELSLEVVAANIPENTVLYTRWLYADCIANAHNVEIFSEEHWAWLEKYIAAAADAGINMLLVPVHTPPLDTEIGTARPCVQLVDIEKTEDGYRFGFDKFRRYIALCQKYGIRYFEIAHMFSQWGAKFAPNIYVTEKGVLSHRFGWHTPADSGEYVAFLKQYIAAISGELKNLGISENTYFHISDEPKLSNADTYRTAAQIIRPLIGSSKTLDALSDYHFYESGLVECPVTSIAHINGFLPHNVPEQWVYYCCGPRTVYSNVFLAMPSYRVRILGFLIYKYNIKGFLHWGFNYYNAARSLYSINPFVTTSGDGAYSSGDPFIVYPGKAAVYPSIRGEVTREAMEDAALCRAAEEKIGREAVVALIDRLAGGELRFDCYPQGKEYIEALRFQLIELLK